MKIGYARVSTDDQNPALQTDALRAAGCTKIYTDHGVSGTLAKRPQLDRCLKALKPGDTLVVWKLDRLGRSLTHLIAVVDDLRKRVVITVLT
jgi:DNA invertase Pin-like site-specific DNA recombinase